jgi:alanyl-tRNA synthetase
VFASHKDIGGPPVDAHQRFEDAGVAQGLRKASESEGTLRIVSINGPDRSRCGGTRVRATGEIGPILLRRTEKIRQLVRVEFVCGGRADRGDKGQRILSAPPATVCPELEDHQPCQH